MLMVPNPIPVMLHCPSCRELHICEQVSCTPERRQASHWPTVHSCACGHRWEPCDYPVRGRSHAF